MQPDDILAPPSLPYLLGPEKGDNPWSVRRNTISCTSTAPGRLSPSKLAHSFCHLLARKAGSATKIDIWETQGSGVPE